MMIDPDTTSHMTGRTNHVFNRTECDGSINLANESYVTATKMGFRKINWQGLTRPMEVTLAKTLVTLDIKRNLLTIPALVKKDSTVLFVPGKALFIDLQNENNILGYAKQETDGLFYIAE